MDTDEFSRWVDFHASVFGLPEDARSGMAACRESFSAGRYTTSELALATRRMILETPAPRFLNEHLSRINGHVRMIKSELRVEAEKKGFARTAADYRGTCELCGGEGFCVVPHPNHVRQGEWIPTHLNRLGDPVRPTAAVKCTCEAGRFKGGTSMTLETYRRNVHPDPFELMRMNEPVREAAAYEDVPTLVRVLAVTMSAPKALEATRPPVRSSVEKDDDDRWTEDPEPDDGGAPF